MRTIFAAASILFLSLLNALIANAANLSIDVQDFSCQEGYYSISFSVKNPYTYNRRPTVAFKLVKDDQVVGCESKTLDVPAGSTESSELKLDLPCDGETVLQYRVYDLRDRNRVNLWLSDCPR